MREKQHVRLRASHPASHRFLEWYGQALSSGDLNVIVDCRGVPAFVLSDDGARAVTKSKEVEAFFGSAVAQYRSQGFASTRAVAKQIEQLGHSIFSVDVRWINLDEDGVERASESSRYTLKASADEQLRIQVAVMKTDAD